MDLKLPRRRHWRRYGDTPQQLRWMPRIRNPHRRCLHGNGTLQQRLWKCKWTPHHHQPHWRRLRGIGQPLRWLHLKGTPNGCDLLQWSATRVAAQLKVASRASLHTGAHPHPDTSTRHPRSRRRWLRPAVAGRTTRRLLGLRLVHWFNLATSLLERHNGAWGLSCGRPTGGSWKRCAAFACYRVIDSLPGTGSGDPLANVY